MTGRPGLRGTENRLQQTPRLPQPVCIFQHFSTYILYDVKVKSILKALRLVKLHKQPKGLGERP